jgi:hypothetical protein
MSFSLSTFTVEVDHSPAIAFQAKWQAEAEKVYREWLNSHWDELAKEGPGGVEWPPISKLRLARPSERAAYEADGNSLEFIGDVKIVKLIVAEIERAPQVSGDAPDDADKRDEHDGRIDN